MRQRVRRIAVYIIAPITGILLVSCLPLFLGCSSTVGPTLPSPEGYTGPCSSALIDPPDNSGNDIVEGTGGQPDFFANDATLSPPIFPDPVSLPALGSTPGGADYEPSANETLTGGTYNYNNITINGGITVRYEGGGPTTLTAAGNLTINAGTIRCVDNNLTIYVQGNVVMDGGQITTFPMAAPVSVDLTLICGGSVTVDRGSIGSGSASHQYDGGGVLVVARGGDVQVITAGSIGASVTPSSGPDRNCTVLASGRVVVDYSSIGTSSRSTDSTGGGVLVGTVNGNVELNDDASISAMGGAADHAVEVRSGQGVVVADYSYIQQRLQHLPAIPTGLSVYALNGPIQILTGSDVYTRTGPRSGDLLLQARGQVLIDDTTEVYTGASTADSGSVTIIGDRCADGESPAVECRGAGLELYTGNSSGGMSGDIEIQGFVSTEGTSTAISWDSVSIRTGTGSGGGDVILRTRCCAAG